MGLTIILDYVQNLVATIPRNTKTKTHFSAVSWRKNKTKMQSSLPVAALNGGE